MKLERKRNAIRGISVGFLNKIVTTLFPFVIRTIIIHTLGTDYLGLSSLFKSVLQVLSLSELGIGSAMVYNMYKPIADNDFEEQAALVRLYKKIYKVIGSVIFIGGIITLPFIKLFIYGTAPDDLNIYILYAIYIFNSSVSYFIASYRSTILSAYQRRDIVQGIGLTVNTGLYLVQIICLALFKNYYLYVIWLPIFTLLENLITACYVGKHYPQIVHAKTKRTGDFKKILLQVKDLFGQKLSNVVTNSVDTIVISSFLGLSMVSIYNNYYYLMSAVNGLLDIVYQAILAGVGNSLATESKEKNKRDFMCFFYMNSWIVGWCSVCFLCLFQPMMIVWMGEKLLLGFNTVVLLAIYFYSWKIRQAIITYKDASGMWHEDRFRPYVEIAVNLSVNIILVQLIGINGIVISTIVSMLFVSFPWESYVFIKRTDIISYKKFILKNIVNIIITVIVGIITYWVCSLVSKYSIWTLVIRLIICIVLPNIVFVSYYCRFPEVKFFINTIRKFLLIRG